MNPKEKKKKRSHAPCPKIASARSLDRRRRRGRWLGGRRGGRATRGILRTEKKKKKRMQNVGLGMRECGIWMGIGGLEWLGGTEEVLRREGVCDASASMTRRNLRSQRGG